jgi:hypothetical protein
MMAQRGNQISRRMALRGFGVSLALPYLDINPVFGAPLHPVTSGHLPTRMAFIFVPNGVNLTHWKPKTEGYGYDLPSILEPLAPLRDDVMVLSGLAHDKGRPNGDGAGDHARSASVFLTGAQPRKTDGENIRSGISVDQLAAKQIGHLTRFSSMELGVDSGKNAGGCDSGYSCAYSSNISWLGERTPAAKEINPRLVFERMFAAGTPTEVDRNQQRRAAMRKSILDFVSEDAKSLQNHLGRADHLKLDEYLTGVREIERRLATPKENTYAAIDSDYLAPEGIPGDYREHIRLMCDMLVLAFQTDLTRIGTLMFANAGDNRNYRKIGVPDGHHDISHHGRDPVKLEKIRQINRFHVEQFSYLLTKLKSIREGERTLLDNCMICYGSGLSDGDRHNHDDLPVLLAGSGGGTIDSGRHIRVQPETPMCNLFLSMLDRMGVKAPFHGDSTGRLPGLTV